MTDGTIFKCEVTYRGVTTIEDYRYDASWGCWQVQKKGKWAKVTNTGIHKRVDKAYHSQSEVVAPQLTLFPIDELASMKAQIGELKALVNNPSEMPEWAKGKFQSLAEAHEELKVLVAPAPDNTRHLLHDDITKETIIEPIMYREDILGPKPKYRTIQRHHVGDSRYYVQQFEQPDGSWSRPSLYQGVTSIGKKVLPMPRERLKWWCSFPTYEDAETELNLLSAKGTVMHTLLALAIQKVLPDFGTADFDRLVRQQISNQGISPNDVMGEWLPFFHKALVGFKQFCYDRKVVFLAVEIVLGVPHEVDANGHHVEGYFAQLDFILEMDRKHYQDGFLKGRRAKMPDKPTNGRKPSKKDFDSRRPFVQYIPASTDWEWSSCDTDRFCERNNDPIVFRSHEEWQGVTEADMPTDSLRTIEIPQVWMPYPDAMLPEERERVLAIIDAKSGKHDYPDHDLQLGLQIPLVKAAFPHMDFTKLRVYNWHPSDFRESSMSEKLGEGKEADFGYNLIDKTGRMNQRWLESTLATWREFYVEPLPIKAIYQGSPNIDTPPSENIRFADYPTYWEEKVARATHHGFADL